MVSAIRTTSGVGDHLAVSVTVTVLGHSDRHLRPKDALHDIGDRRARRPD